MLHSVHHGSLHCFTQSHQMRGPSFPDDQSELLSSFNRLSNAPKSRHTAYDESCVLFSNNTYKMSEKAMEQCTINLFSCITFATQKAMTAQMSAPKFLLLFFYHYSHHSQTTRKFSYFVAPMFPRLARAPVHSKMGALAKRPHFCTLRATTGPTLITGCGPQHLHIMPLIAENNILTAMHAI